MSATLTDRSEFVITPEADAALNGLASGFDEAVLQFAASRAAQRSAGVATVELDDIRAACQEICDLIAKGVKEGKISDHAKRVVERLQRFCESA